LICSCKIINICIIGYNEIAHDFSQVLYILFCNAMSWFNGSQVRFDTIALNNVDVKMSQNDVVEDIQKISTTVASINTREISNINSVSNEKFSNVSIPADYHMDASPYVMRPFFLENVVWDAVYPRGTFLASQTKMLPGDVIRSNASLLNAMKIASYYRANLLLNFSVAGTIAHGGCVLVSVMPPVPRGSATATFGFVNSLLTSPHAFLFANEATSVSLEVPWYCNSDVATLDVDTIDPGYIPSYDITDINGNYGTLYFYVLNPLAPSGGSSATLNIVVEACFKKLDISVPTPRYVTWSPDALSSVVSGIFDTGAGYLKKTASDAIDAGRSALREWTGLHNPNNPTIKERDIITFKNFPNNVETEQLFEKLDPYYTFNRILHEPDFGTDKDEQSLSYITSKKQFLATIVVRSDMVVGTRLFVRPIAPWQGGLSDTLVSNNIELLYLLSRGWRGSLKLHIQSVMNNKQQTKLRVLKMYNPSNQAQVSYPVYGSIVNAPSDLLEFTSGGQEHVVDLPYLCRNDITPITLDNEFAAMFHGLYYIFLAQPLVTADNSPNSVEFNIYMSGGPDLQFYGYSTFVTPSIGLVSPPPPREGEAEFVPESLEVMNKPQKQEQQVDESVHAPTHFDRLKPNLDIRPYIRRMYKVQAFTMPCPKGTTNRVINLNRFIGEYLEDGISSPAIALAGMYYGKKVGFKMNFRLTFTNTIATTDNISFQFKYVPPTYDTIAVGNQILAAPVKIASVEVDRYNLAASPSLPLTYQNEPVYNIDRLRTNEFEFVVPDVTFYKYVGSPSCLTSPSTPAARRIPYSTSDCGAIWMQASNLATAAATVGVEVFVGFTDESRLGFHSMAPRIELDLQNYPYGQSATTPYFNRRNPHLYYTVAP